MPRSGSRLLCIATAALAAAGCSPKTQSAGDDDDDAPASSRAASSPAAAAAPGRVVLTAAAERTAGIRVEPADGGLSGAPGLSVPGEVQIDSSRVAVISSRAPGRIERLLAAQGQTVGAGQAVATLSSPEYLAAQSDLVQAARRAALLEGTADQAGARALVGAARQRLLLLGASSAQVSHLLAGGEPSLFLPVRAPFGGTIMETLAQAGMAVEPGAPIFRIANLSEMNVVARVPEQSLGLIRPGQSASVTVAAFATVLTGRVVRILQELDPETRTARVLVRVPNPGLALRARMFATVRLATPAAVAAAPAAGVSIPSSAVQTEGDTRFVFVQVAPHIFEKRIVQVADPLPGAAADDRVRAVAGLSPGDLVVVQGAFTLRSELAKAGLKDTD